MSNLGHAFESLAREGYNLHELLPRASEDKPSAGWSLFMRIFEQSWKGKERGYRFGCQM